MKTIVIGTGPGTGKLLSHYLKDQPILIIEPSKLDEADQKKLLESLKSNVGRTYQLIPETAEINFSPVLRKKIRAEKMNRQRQNKK